MKRWKVRPPGSNWGDFGEDDQIGRLNLLTPERRLASFREVTQGLAFNLSLPLDYPGGNVLSPQREPPRLFAAEHREGGTTYSAYCRCLSRYVPQFTDVTNDDAVILYTQYSTQWDSLAHIGQEFDADGDGRAEIVFYNGYLAGEHIGVDQDGVPRAGALGIERMSAAGVQGRGVLVDLYRIYGRKRERVGYDALMRALESQNVQVETGDFLCVYTGFADLVLEQNKQPDGRVLRSSCVGLDGSDSRLLQWITDSGLVAICADNHAVEYVSAKPRSAERHALMPLHEHCLFKLGIYLGELWHFRPLAEWLAAHGRNRFLLSAPPLRLPGSVGSPVTPIATV